MNNTTETRLHIHRNEGDGKGTALNIFIPEKDKQAPYGGAIEYYEFVLTTEWSTLTVRTGLHANAEQARIYSFEVECWEDAMRPIGSLASLHRQMRQFLAKLGRVAGQPNIKKHTAVIHSWF